MHDERGGVLLKALLVVFIVIVGASIAFYWYAGRQDPLALGTEPGVERAPSSRP